MANVKKVDCALLPPCAKTLRNKTRRAHFISIVWGNADSAHPGEGLDPLSYGWKDKNGDYAPDWLSGPALPDYLFQEGDCWMRILLISQILPPSSTIPTISVRI